MDHSEEIFSAFSQRGQQIFGGLPVFGTVNSTITREPSSDLSFQTLETVARFSTPVGSLDATEDPHPLLLPPTGENRETYCLSALPPGDVKRAQTGDVKRAQTGDVTRAQTGDVTRAHGNRKRKKREESFKLGILRVAGRSGDPRRQCSIVKFVPGTGNRPQIARVVSVVGGIGCQASKVRIVKFRRAGQPPDEGEEEEENAKVSVDEDRLAEDGRVREEEQEQEEEETLADAVLQEGPQCEQLKKAIEEMAREKALEERELRRLQHNISNLEQQLEEMKAREKECTYPLL